MAKWRRRLTALQKPEPWILEPGLMAEHYWEWALGSLHTCLPFWPSALSANARHWELVNGGVVVSAVAGSPVMAARERGIAVELDETTESVSLGTAEFVDFDSAAGWTVEALVFLDDYGSGPAGFPAVMQCATGHTTEPFFLFFADAANYDGVNVGWRVFTTSAGGGTKGDTAGAGLAGSALIGHWSHVFVRFDGIDNDHVDSYDVVYEGGGTSGVFAIEFNGGYAAAPNTNILGGQDGVWDGQIALLNFWQTRLTDSQCEARIRDPFSFLARPRRLVSTAPPGPPGEGLPVLMAYYEG